jgi:hypothetical protein
MHNSLYVNQYSIKICINFFKLLFVSDRFIIHKTISEENQENYIWANLFEQLIGQYNAYTLISCYINSTVI